MGLWANGRPTAKGAQDAAMQVAGALIAGTGGKGEKPEGFDEAVHAWRRGDLKSVFDSPDYQRYRADLSGRRQLWGAANYHRGVVQEFEKRLAEPGTTPEGMVRLQKHLERAKGGYEGAKQAAAFFGHDVEGPIPRDEWMLAEFPPARDTP